MVPYPSSRNRIARSVWSASSLSTLRSAATEDGLALSNGTARPKARARSARLRALWGLANGEGGKMRYSSRLRVFAVESRRGSQEESQGREQTVGLHYEGINNRLYTLELPLRSLLLPEKRLSSS